MPVRTRPNTDVVQAAAPPAPVGREWFDTTYNIERRYNGFEWIPGGAERVLDRVQVSSIYYVPTTAVGIGAAVGVPGLTVSPTCPPGAIRLSAFAFIGNGATGTGTLTVFIGDATSGSTSPVPLSGQFVTANTVSATGYANLTVDYPISAAEAGTRIFKLYAFISSATMTKAFVYGARDTNAWIRAEID